MWLTESTHIGKSMRVDTNNYDQPIFHPGHSCKTRLETAGLLKKRLITYLIF